MNYYHLLLPQSPDIDPGRVLAGQDQTQVLFLVQVGHPHTVAKLGGRVCFNLPPFLFTRSCAALLAADLDWIVGPEYSLGGYITWDGGGGAGQE